MTSAELNNRAMTDERLMDIKRSVRHFILENFLFTNDESALEDARSLIETGTMDSTGVLELIMFLEETFGVQVSDAEALPQNLDSVTRIVAFLEHKLERKPHGARS